MTANLSNRASHATENSEKVFSNPAKESVKHAESKEIKEAAVGREAYEAISDTETVETSGRIAETIKDADEQKGDGMGTGQGSKNQTFDPAKIRENLLKQMPNENIMKKEIEREIKKEVNYLHKKAMKMLRSPSQIDYFEMTNLMRKIRELKGILVMLAKATFDSLKTLWLRYVHGVM